MGLYNMLFGVNPLSDVVLATLGLTRADTGRFRDCYLSNGEIAIYTRNGGGNRESYMPDFSSHPQYLRDEDDDFDCTYATIYFSYPPEFADGLRAIEENKPWNPSRQWLDMIESLKGGKE